MFHGYRHDEDRAALVSRIGSTGCGEEIVQMIYKTMLRLCKIPPGNYRLYVSVLFVQCYENDEMFSQPVYVVKGEGVTVNFIDTMARRYKSWTDFKDNNRWNAMDIGTPFNGYYSCSPDGITYDKEANALVEFTVTPAKKGLHKLIGILDGTSTVIAIVSGVVGIASLFTPVGWVCVGTIASYTSVAAMGAAGYGLVRSTYQIVDKAKHDEDMLSLDSFVLYGSLALTVMDLTFSFGTLKVAPKGVREFLTRTLVKKMKIGVDAAVCAAMAVVKQWKSFYQKRKID
ncbi:unnamed protein product [Auanema sp. JU1783]|nr:unnamed protein product [Auanema sp. JU1783]